MHQLWLQMLARVQLCREQAALFMLRVLQWQHLLLRLRQHHGSQDQQMALSLYVLPATCRGQKKLAQHDQLLSLLHLCALMASPL